MTWKLARSKPGRGRAEMQGSSVPLGRNHVSPSGGPLPSWALRIVLTSPPYGAPGLRTQLFAKWSFVLVYPTSLIWHKSKYSIIFPYLRCTVYVCKTIIYVNWRLCTSIIRTGASQGRQEQRWSTPWMIDTGQRKREMNTLWIHRQLGTNDSTHLNQIT